MRGVKHFSEVQPKHLGAGVSGTVGGGDEEFGETDEDDSWRQLIGTHFRAHLHQTNPPVLLFMSTIPAFLPFLSLSLFVFLSPFNSLGGAVPASASAAPI